MQKCILPCQLSLLHQRAYPVERQLNYYVDHHFTASHSSCTYITTWGCVAALQLNDWLSDNLPEGSRIGFDPFCHTVDSINKLKARLQVRSLLHVLFCKFHGSLHLGWSMSKCFEGLL
eukprot:GHRR01033423.1.p1 GENE.GHRR01033423.1~~GHRR01033423.1.p1  ORF type:complete len:118 (-),score=7.81 GHRR01033423.1:488-841(-)